MAKKTKNKIEKIKKKLSFYDVFCDITIPEKMYTNYRCPFCGNKGTFSILHDEYGKCFHDTCEWKGDAIQLYMDYYKIDTKTAIEHLDLEYNLNLYADELTKSEILTERGKYLKKLADIKFIRQFRVMMEVLNFSRNYLESVLKVNRKYISLILNEKIDHEDLSQKRYNTILGLMTRFYKENQDEMLHKMDLYFKDETAELVKKVNQYLNEIYNR